MDDSIHSSPHPVEVLTTGFSPREPFARRVAFEVLMYELHGSVEIRWVYSNDGETLDIRATDSEDRTWNAWMRLGQGDPENPGRDVRVIENILLWSLLREAMDSVRANPLPMTPPLKNP